VELVGCLYRLETKKTKTIIIIIEQANGKKEMKFYYERGKALTPKGPNTIFFGNIAILGSSLQIEFLFFSFENFTQHVLAKH